MAREIAEPLSAVLLAAAFVVVQVLIGGTRLLFALPAYALLAMVALLAVFSLRKTKPQPDQLCLWSAVAFFSYVLVRGLLSPVPYLARPDIYSVLGGLIVYLFISCVLIGATSRSLILVVLVVAGMVHTFIGAVQFQAANNFMPLSFLQRFDYGRRASGFYVCPNHLAGCLEVVGIFGLSLMCWARWPPWAKLLIGYAALTCYVGLVLTGSRGGYLSAGGSLVIFAALSLIVLHRGGFGPFGRLAGAGLLAASVLIVGAVFFVAKSNFLSDRAQNVFDKSNIRLGLWQAALQQWKLQPVVGTGSGTYLFYGREFRAPEMQLDPMEVHNDYLHLLCEYGAVGALLFVGFLGPHVWRGWKTFQRVGLERLNLSSDLASNALAFNLGALSAVGAYVIHSFVDFNLHIPANVLLMAFVFGIIVNPGIPSNESKGNEKSAMSWKLALVALGLIVTLQCARLLPGEYFTERARMALRDFRPTDTIFFAHRALENEKQNPLLYDYLGRARASQAAQMRDPRARKSFYQAAVEAFSKAKELSPQDKIFVIDLALAYDALGRFTEAEWMYHKAFLLDPRSISTQRYYDSHIQRWQSGEETLPKTDFAPNIW